MIIILNGAIASGKTTIGNMLADGFRRREQPVAFYDLDEALHAMHPSQTWVDELEKLTAWLAMRKDLAEKTLIDLKAGRIVILAGPFFTREEIDGYLDYLPREVPVFLYTLHTPLEQRLSRERVRQHNIDQVLVDQQQLILQLVEKHGAIVENEHEPELTILTILKLLQSGEGKIQ